MAPPPPLPPSNPKGSSRQNDGTIHRSLQKLRRTRLHGLRSVQHTINDSTTGASRLPFQVAPDYIPSAASGSNETRIDRLVAGKPAGQRRHASKAGLARAG